MIRKRPLVVFFAFAAFALILFSNTFLRSERVNPPAFYANNPPLNLNCASCHACVPSHDSTNFVLEMGLDTSSLTEVISGITTYTPGVLYYLRINATKPSSDYGFELTAEDSANSGTAVTSFTVLNSANTIIQTIGSSYISHHNANSNNQWTFQWTAPAAYTGLITFYYVGNDGNGDDLQSGDQIYLMTKEIRAHWGATGVEEIGDKLNALSVFPSVFDQHVEISFDLKQNAKVEGSIVDLNGRVVKSILDEGLMAGSFNRNIDLSGLQAGVYLVKIQIGEAFTVRKIVKV